MNALGRALAPLQWLYGVVWNPILQRELRASGRRRSTYIIRGGYAAAFSLVAITAVTSTMETYGYYNSATARAQGLARLAESIVLFIVWFQFFTLVLLSPTMTSPSICEEKLRGTLGALMTTPLTSTRIVLGKLMGRMYQALLLTLVSAPLLLAIRVFGGVPIEWIVAYTLVTLSTAVFAGSLGLLFAMWHDRSAPAAMFALLTLGLMFAAPPLIFFAMRQSSYLGLPSIGISIEQINSLIPYGIASCPPFALAALATDGPQQLGIPWLAGTPFDKIWVLTVVYMLMCSAFTLWIASLVMRRLLLEASGGAVKAKPVPENKPARDTKKRTKHRVRLARLADQPVYWREVSRRWINGRFERSVLAFVLVFSLGFAYYKTDMDEQPIHMLIGLVGMILLMLCASVMTASSINGERATETWDALMTSPVSGRAVVLGKYFAVVRRLAPLAGLVSLHFIVMSFRGFISWPATAMSIALISVPPLFYLATGLAMSLRFTKSSVSSVCNIILLLAMWFGIPILIIIMLEFNWERSEFEDLMERFVFGSHPLLMLVSVIDGDIEQQVRERSKPFSFADDRVTMGYMIQITTALIVAHALLAIGVLWASILAFTRLSGRSS
ncbi:MAG: hypothetical protein ED559_11690 [Phycisphaera sp.]|nr:MAG: hypothetical protein ED559_11690 [Phycisphaera sp.]